MKASELRVGNIVNVHSHGEWHHVILSAQDILEISFGEKKAEFIPLTEEWYLRLGGSFKEFNEFPLLNIKYVHQFQNLLKTK